MKSKTIRLDDDLAEWLRQEAFRRRVSQQKLIDHALGKYRRFVEGGKRSEAAYVAADS